MPSQAASSPGPLEMLFPLAMVILIFYVLVFRPQSKARKEQEQRINSLKKHDAVVTVGGLHGIVVNVKPETVTLRIDENVRVDVDKSAIIRVVQPRSDGKEADVR